MAKINDETLRRLVHQAMLNPDVMSERDLELYRRAVENSETAEVPQTEIDDAISRFWKRVDQQEEIASEETIRFAASTDEVAMDFAEDVVGQVHDGGTAYDVVLEESFPHRVWLCGELDCNATIRFGDRTFEIRGSEGKRKHLIKGLTDVDLVDAFAEGRIEVILEVRER